MPVLHHVRAGGKVAVGLEPELSPVGEPLGKALGLGLEDVVVVGLCGPCHIAAEGDLHAGQVLLRGVIDVGAGHRKGLCVLIHVGLAVEAIGVAPPGKVRVVGHELVGSSVLVHDAPLPRKEPGNQLSLIPLELRAEAPVDRAPDIRKVLPGIHPVAPVVKTEGPVHLLTASVELLL